jgi:hypothetical protein
LFEYEELVTAKTAASVEDGCTWSPRCLSSWSRRECIIDCGKRVDQENLATYGRVAISLPVELAITSLDFNLIYLFFSNLGIITWAFNGSCLGFQSKIILEAFQTDTGRLNGIRIELGL